MVSVLGLYLANVLPPSFSGTVAQAAAATTFLPVADGYVDASSPSTNFGTSPVLRVDPSPDIRSYLRFSVQDVPGTIVAATLNVYANTTSGSGYAARGTDGTWTEAGLTYTNSPSVGGVVGVSGKIDGVGWTTVDVTALVAGNGTVNLALTKPSGGLLNLASREASQDSFAPRLVVEYAEGQSPPTATPTRTPTATPTRTATPAATANPTGPFTFSPVADTYVSDSSPTTNYGTATTLRVDGSGPVQQSYLRFVVQNVAGTVTQATLRVYANSNHSTGYRVYPVADTTWGETTLNDTNKPTIGSLIGPSGAVSTGTWTTVDVTSFITGNGTYSLALDTASPTALSLASRQAGANAPQLVVETGATQSTATPTKTSGPTLTPTLVLTATQTPLAGTDPILVGAGDIASCSSSGDEAVANLLDSIFAGTVLGQIVTLGDNAYESGAAAEFANCYAPSWGRYKTQTRPAVGNHEYLTPGASGHYGYFGAAAGDPTKGYYSYELGAWHVAVINSNYSQVGGCGTGSPQEQWLRADLALLWRLVRRRARLGVS